MPVLLEDSEIDLEGEALDVTMSEASEMLRAAPVPVDDLRDGKRGNRITKGRAVARRAWMWDGTETVLPIAWNPEGTKQDGGRSYMSKKHCLCCNAGGFRGACLKCIRNNCVGCRAGTDKSKIIPNFYLSKEKVPFPQKFYGAINCFQVSCPRKNGMGFKTDEDMRMHARTKHRMEYASRQEALAAIKADETTDLRRRVDELTTLLLKNGQQPVQATVAVSVAEPAPLYVAEPKRPKGRQRRARQ